MKKFLLTLSLLLCATTIPLVSMVVHNPAPGANLQLGGLPGIDTTGAIMQIVLDHPSFEEERNTIRAFLGIQGNGAINLSYQTIVARINNAPADMPGALETIEAFERAIMHYLHTQNYIYYIDNKWLNIFVTGIRWNWINPKCWLNPAYWFSDHNAILQQCMRELSYLARITSKHSVIAGTRMNTTVESYLHWRRNILAIITSYFTANLGYHTWQTSSLEKGWDKSTLKMLKHGGLKGISKVITQAGSDVINTTKYAYNGIIQTGKSVEKSLEPYINGIINGDQTNNKKKTSSASFFVTPKNSSSVSTTTPTKPKAKQESWYRWGMNHINAHTQNIKECFSDNDETE